MPNGILTFTAVKPTIPHGVINWSERAKYLADQHIIETTPVQSLSTSDPRIEVGSAEPEYLINFANVSLFFIFFEVY